MVHVEGARRKLASRARPLPKAEGDDPHVLDRRIGEEPLDVAPARYNMKGREQQRGEPHRDHQRAPARSPRHGPASQHILKAQGTGIERADVEEEEAGEHRRDRRGDLRPWASGSQACSGARGPTLVP